MWKPNGRAGGRSWMLPVVAGLVVSVLGMPSALAAAPTISSFSPTCGQAGTQVIITGTAFQDAPSAVSAVTCNGTAATTFTVNSDTQITATVPAGATTGPIAVTDSEGTATSTASFVVATAAGPCITTFTPTSGNPGTVVTITVSGTTTIFFSPSLYLRVISFPFTPLTDCATVALVEYDLCPQVTVTDIVRQTRAV